MIDWEDARRLSASIAARGPEWCCCDQCNLARAFAAIRQQLKEMVEMCEVSPRDLETYKYEAIVEYTMARSRAILEATSAFEEEPNELNDAWARGEQP